MQLITHKTIHDENKKMKNSNVLRNIANKNIVIKSLTVIIIRISIGNIHKTKEVRVEKDIKM